VLPGVNNTEEDHSDAAPAEPRARCRKPRKRFPHKGRAPAAPCEQIPQEPHRQKHNRMSPLFPACVAEPVSRKMIEQIPKAIEAREKEANNLRDKQVWDLKTVREWDEVALEARNKEKRFTSAGFSALWLSRILNFLKETQDGSTNTESCSKVIEW
jgi:hypothetical protein